MSGKTARTGAEVLAYAESLIKDYTTEEVLQKYDEWAADYDRDMTVEGMDYTGPQFLAEIVSRLLSKQKNARLLDAAAGTGLAGELLKKEGFTNMDALDGSAKMLECAASKNAYQKLIHAVIGPKPLDIEDGAYDAVLAIGLFVENHVSPSCFKELIRITKCGGYCVLGIYESVTDTYVPEVERLVAEGKWTIKEKIFREKIMASYGGTIYVMQKSK